MTRRAYTNAINPVDCSLGIEQVIISDYPNTFTPARIDLDSLPAGFYDLGAVVEDTPMVRATKTKFQLQTGLPRVTQFQAVQALSAQFQFSLHSNSWRKVQVALGNYSAVSSAAFAGTVASMSANGLTFYLSGAPTTPIVAGQMVIIAANTATVDAIDGLEVRIASVSGSTAYTCSDPPYKTITAGNVVMTYTRVIQYIGTPRIRYFHVLGVADFIDGVQIVHEFPKCAPAEDWEEKFSPDQNGRIPITLDALGFNTTINGCTQQIVGIRHYFPPVSAAC